MRSQQRIGILGLGNLLLSDEGFGVHFINYLTERYEIPRMLRSSTAAPPGS